MFLKKQILSLNDQFQDLMVSVSKLYPDILDEDFAQKSDKSILHVIELDPQSKQARNESKQTRQESKQTRDGSFAFTTDKANSPENITPIRADRRSRWNEWRESHAKRRSFVEGELQANERHRQTKLDSPQRPTSLHVDNLNLVTPESDVRKARGHRSRSEPRPSDSSSSPDDGRYALDSERRRRIRQRLKESRKTLDVVHLGLF